MVGCLDDGMFGLCLAYRHGSVVYCFFLVSLLDAYNFPWVRGGQAGHTHRALAGMGRTVWLLFWIMIGLGLASLLSFGVWYRSALDSEGC